MKIDHLLFTPFSSPSLPYRHSSSDGDRGIAYRHELAFDTLILFTDAGYRASLLLAICLFLLTVSALICTIVIYFVLDRPVEGWTTTMLLLSGGFAGIFLILTIIIKYLSILVDLVFKRQKYLVESVERL